MAKKTDPLTIRTQILLYLANHGKTAFRPKELAKKLGYLDQKAFQAFMDVVTEMIRKNDVATEKGSKIKYLPPFNKEATGVLTVHPQGYGFVKVEGLETDLYIPEGHLGYALDGDTVRVSLFAPSKNKARRQEAKVVEVLERKRKQTVGTFIEDEEDPELTYVRSDDNRLLYDVLVLKRNRRKAKAGDKVLVSLDRFNEHLGVPEGSVLDVLGRADDPKVQVLALAMSRDVRAKFPKEVLLEAESIPLEIPVAEAARRLDLRQKRVFTIDPYDAKDFDDAIHIVPLANGNFEVGVHIADVSHYIPIGSALDQEAYFRATSVYLVDRVIPMLPEKLSNGVCSLRPHEDKCTYSVLFELTKTGKIVQYQLGETLTHSHQRFTYEEAQAILDGEDTVHPFREEVLLAWQLAEALRKQRFKQGAVRFNRPEVKVKLDEAGKPIEMYTKVTREANWLIEELMLLANKTVAKHAASLRSPELPFVYRTHDAPDPAKMLQLAEFLKVLGIHLPLKNSRVQADDLNLLLADLQGKPIAPLVEDAALRAMAKAKYTVANIGHYGLSFDFYSHFTSPIRRYPDLMVHRLLKAYAALSPETPHEKAAHQKVVPTSDSLDAACTHCSFKEKEAEDAERESIRYKQVEYMQQHLGEAFDGVISGVTNFGIFVEITSLLVEGMVPLRDLTDDYYEYDEKRFCLIGKSKRKIIRMGDPVRVRVAQANLETRRIDFQLLAK